MSTEAVPEKPMLYTGVLPQFQLRARAKTRFSIRKDEAGRLMPRHYEGVDPDLVGERAFSHPRVREWWSWLLEGYTPRASVALVTGAVALAMAGLFAATLGSVMWNGALPEVLAMGSGS